VTVVACCQIAPALGDPAANRELAADAVSRAAAQGAAVVVLPELVSSGYVFESRAEAKASAEERRSRRPQARAVPPRRRRTRPPGRPVHRVSSVSTRTHRGLNW
jgi:predicted amidohydrolase